ARSGLRKNQWGDCRADGSHCRIMARLNAEQSQQHTFRTLPEFLANVMIPLDPRGEGVPRISSKSRRSTTPIPASPQKLFPEEIHSFLVSLTEPQHQILPPVRSSDLQSNGQPS